MREKYSQMSKEDLIDILLGRDSKQHEWCDDMHHLLEVFIDVISHKKAIISGQFAYKPNKYTDFAVGLKKTLTREVFDIDSLTFGSLEFFINSTMPLTDPDFKALEHKYYEVDFPKEYEEHKKKSIQLKIDEYIKEHHRKPSEKEIERLKWNTDYDMSCFYHPAEITPSIYPIINTIKSETSDVRKDSDLDNFVNWLRSIDITLGIHHMPDGSAIEWKKLSLENWKKY